MRLPRFTSLGANADFGMNEDKKNFSFKKSFMRGELHMGLWSFLKKGTGALDSFFILSSLSLYQFGVYQLLLSLYAILSDFFHDVFGEVITNDITRFIGEGREDKAKRLFYDYTIFRFGMALIPCIAILFLAPVIGRYYGYGADFISFVRLMSFLFVADAVVLIATLLLKLRLQFAILAPRATAQKFIQFLVLACFYFFSHITIREIFLAQIIGSLGVVAVMLPSLLGSVAPWRAIAPSRGLLMPSIVRSYGKWALPQSFLTDFTGKIRPWLIKLFLGTEVVGLFGVANTFISAVKDLLPIRTPGLLVPRRTDDPAAMMRFYRYGTKYYVWLALALCIVAAGGVPLVIYLLFPKFSSALPLFYLLLVSIPIFAFTKPVSFLLVAFRKQEFLFWQAVFQSALSFILLMMLLPIAGVAGLAYTEIISIAVSGFLRQRFLIREGLASRFRLHTLLTVDAEDRTNLTSANKYFWGLMARIG